MSIAIPALRTSAPLRIAAGIFLVGWLVVAAFPLFWIAALSFKVPLDAFSTNPLDVVLGPRTAAAHGGISVQSLLPLVGIIVAWAWQRRNDLTRRQKYIRIVATSFVTVLVLRAVVDAIGGPLTRPLFGITWEHYYEVWVGHAFYRQFINSAIVTAGVVCVSLTAGTLAGYALARTSTAFAFWLLIAALVFRALPHSVLLAGYLPTLINSQAILAPLWHWQATAWFFQLFTPEAPTLYGRILPVILVLVAINQPFTIWMLRSFFSSIPVELDEAAQVDGCTQLQAFRQVIMPVMWPGVITTGLFSFLLAYNDYLVTSLLLDQQSQTMVPAIAQFLNSENSAADQIQAIAAAVSITAPLFLLVMVFQRQIVSGLTAGAVKG